MMTESQRAALAEYAAVKGQCPARERLAALFDDGVYTETGSNLRAGENLAGVVTAYGYIGGTSAYAFSQDSTVMKGAVSLAHSAKICKMFELAARNGVPVVGIYDSCGAFVEDGADALNAYSDILLSMGSLSGVVPMVSVISGVCAGTMAMIASSADFSVITEGAELYLDASGNNASAESAAKSGAVSACIGLGICANCAALCCALGGSIVTRCVKIKLSALGDNGEISGGSYHCHSSRTYSGNNRYHGNYAGKAAHAEKNITVSVESISSVLNECAA